LIMVLLVFIITLMNAGGGENDNAEINSERTRGVEEDGCVGNIIKVFPKSWYGQTRKSSDPNCYLVYVQAAKEYKCAPGFLGIGIQKAATTQVHYWLNQHPKISTTLPLKEIHYFDFLYTNETLREIMTSGGFANANMKGARKKLMDTKFDGINIWLNIFESFHALHHEGVQAGIAGEWTPKYILVPDLPSFLLETLPDLKFLLILRDPTERAWSQYQMDQSSHSTKDEIAGKFHKTVIQQIAAIERVIEKYPSCETLWITLWFEIVMNRDSRTGGPGSQGGFNVLRGMYKYQLENWFKYFSREKFYIADIDKVHNEPTEVLSEITSFLKMPAYGDWQAVVDNPDLQGGTRNSGSKVQMLPETKKMLQEFYAKYNFGLDKMIGIDLHHYNKDKEEEELVG